MSVSAESIDSAKVKALETALSGIEKDYGKGAVMRLEDGAVADVDVISTGSIGLDRALGVGGLPRGRIVEIFGPEASGKTTLALQVIANAQKDGGRAAFIDAEHALDPAYAAALGVNTADLLISQPDHGEQAIEIAERLVSSGAIDVIVIDSVAALIPKAELEAEMEAAQMGLHARLMSKACRKLAGIIKQTNALVVFVNQIRMKIGVTWGSAETVTGGRALQFFASVRIDIRAIGQLKTGDEIVGKRTRVRVVKNKLSAPFRKAEFDVVFGKGCYRPAELIDLGLDIGEVQKSGTWFSIGDTRMGQGKAKACEFLVENAEIADQLENDIREALFDRVAEPDNDEDTKSSAETGDEGSE